MKFRKKPVVIEAVRASEFIAAFREVVAAKMTPGWLIEAYRGGAVTLSGTPPSGVIIKTPEGDMRASPADWIIQGVKGEIYPCKPDIFEATYEAVE